jgi:hypothetical protein
LWTLSLEEYIDTKKTQASPKRLKS